MQEFVKLTKQSTFDRLIEYGQYCLETEIDGKVFSGLILDEANEQAVRTIVELFDSGKGLNVLGEPGSGKTLLFTILQKITHPDSERSFAKSNILELVKDFNLDGHDVFNRWNDRNVFFDDLGTETKGFHYGDRVEVMASFIQYRYELFQSKKLVTHLTSNLTKPEIESRYGVRCASRLFEMTETVVLGSGSVHVDRRKLKNLKNLPFVQHPRLLTEDDKEWLRNYEKMKIEIQNAPKKEYTGTIGQRLREHFEKYGR